MFGMPSHNYKETHGIMQVTKKCEKNIQIAKQQLDIYSPSL